MKIEIKGIPFRKIKGPHKTHDVQVFSLTTCQWCKSLKKILNNHGIEYEFIDLDRLEKPKKKKVLNYLKNFSNVINFPMTFIDGNLIGEYSETLILQYLQ
jgi:glutaredoxin